MYLFLLLALPFLLHIQLCVLYLFFLNSYKQVIDNATEIINNVNLLVLPVSHTTITVLDHDRENLYSETW